MSAPARLRSVVAASSERSELRSAAAGYFPEGSGKSATIGFTANQPNRALPKIRKGALSHNASWKQRVPELRPDPLAVLELRAWARAYLWSVGEFDLHWAVDVLQRDAVYEGLLDAIGQDAVQAILRDAFHQFRGRS